MLNQVIFFKTQEIITILLRDTISTTHQWQCDVPLLDDCFHVFKAAVKDQN